MFESEIEQIRGELNEIYRDLHRHPELGFNEHRTARIIADHLRDCNLQVDENLALTGVCGALDSGKPGRTLLIRADMDCLMIDEQTGCAYQSIYPHRMHACGHDTHITMLLGAAKILSRHPEAFCGRIKFLFEPAEEGADPAIYDQVVAAGCQAGGADALVRNGILDDVDLCFIIHNEPTLPLGDVRIFKEYAYAASDEFTIEIHGRGGHGARPHTAIDPLPAAAEIISAVYAMPAREIAAHELCAITIGQVETPESVWNAVPDRVVLRGGFRTFTEEIRQHFYARIPEIAQHIAAAHRCTANVQLSRGLSPTVNDPEIAQRLAAAFRDLRGGDHVQLTDIPTMASESAGVYLSRKPGAIVLLGSGDPAHELHHPAMLPDIGVLPIGVAVHIAAAACLLNQP